MSVRARTDAIDSRRSSRTPALGVALALGLATLHCEQLPEGYCLPCKKDCPGELVCSPEQRKCVDPHVTMSCDDTASSGDVSSAGGTAGSGGTSNHPTCPSDSSCVPSLVSPERLSVDCSDQPLAVRLDVKCSCDDASRTGSWSLLEGPPGLTLEDGVLGGSPPPGVHSIRASVRIDDSPSVTIHLELEVSECFTFFVGAATDTGAPRVTAARTDTGDVIALPTPGSDALFSSFDLAPAGNLMAQVFTTAGRQELQVFRMTRGSISEVPLKHTGDHVAHAFSLDSRWLALVTSEPSDPSAALLSLIDLEHPEADRAEATVTPTDGLLWSNTGSILRFGEADTLPDQRVVFEHRVHGGELLDPVELQQAATAGVEPLHALVRTPDGFMATFREKLLFVGDARDANERVEHGGAEAFSPGFTWVASGYSPGKRIDYLNTSPGNPHMLATECDLLRAWSPDDSTIFCTTSTSEGSRALVYPVPSERSVPDAIELKFPDGYEQTPESTTTRARVALSNQGAWLALVPNREDGLFVLRAEDFGGSTLVPVLEPPAGSYEWDLLFAHDAFTGVPKRLVVQQGRTLQVATLNGEEPVPQFTEIEAIELPPVPNCELDWFPDLNEWCGAPRFAGNLLLSRTQRYLTFHDDQNRVYLMDLESLEITPLGTLAAACCPECPEDRATNCLLTQ